MILVRLLFREELLRSSLTYFVNKFLELALGVSWLLEFLFLEACVLPRQEAAFIPILRCDSCGCMRVPKLKLTEEVSRPCTYGVTILLVIIISPRKKVSPQQSYL